MIFSILEFSFRSFLEVFAFWGRDPITLAWDGNLPYFFDSETEHEVACPACTQALLQEGEDGELEVKEKFRGKLRYLDESEEDAWQDHSELVMAVLENEPGKLN
jgi:hypothetical protein